jgi:DNA-directed RNA polymerase subunit RPC12/RpoP
MAATIIITCPKCKKQLKGSEAFVGKNVRCKSCGHKFVVEGPARTGPAAPPSAPKTMPPSEKENQGYDFAPGSGVTKTQSPYPKSDSKAEALHTPVKISTGPGDSLSGIPYAIKEAVDLAPRCPQCAMDFDSPDQVICLHCGYNRQTNRRLVTVKTFETTSAQRFTWLLPGFICAGVVFLCVIIVGLLWLAISRFDPDGKESWWAFPLQVWGSVFCAFISWYCGMFAFKRLFKHPNPPENFKQ